MRLDCTVHPGDSPQFRKAYLNQNAPSGPGGAWIHTDRWPDPELHGLLALAQHHGVPTRLLNWSTRSYVAAYFAISDALRDLESEYRKSDCLAVWVLNASQKFNYKELEIIRVPGGNDQNLAAQAGMFTLLRQSGHKGQPFDGEIALDRYFIEKALYLSVPLEIEINGGDEQISLGGVGLAAVAVRLLPVTMG